MTAVFSNASVSTPNSAVASLRYPAELVHALRRHRDSSAVFLSDQVGARLLTRLDFVRLAPQRMLDLGAGMGPGATWLNERFPQAALVSVDLAADLLPPQSIRFWERWRSPARQNVVAQCPALPFREGSFGLIWANLLLPWVEPALLFPEVRRLLAPGGLFLFSCPGPDTLRELRQALAAGSGQETGLPSFPDMHDLGDALVQARLADPVMEREDVTVHYPDLGLLLQDLRRLGPLPGTRPAGLRGRQSWHALNQHYEGLRQQDGLPAGLEIILGQAWKPEPRTGHDGRPVIDIRAVS